MTVTVDIKHFHLFCGLGGGAKGFNRGQARVGNLVAKFRCIGGIDVDPASIRDFTRAAGVDGTVRDLFSRDQFIAFHGREPGPDWREATAGDVRAAAQGEDPDIVFLSAPCKGFSGLLAEATSKTDKYQALNGLTLRGVWLMLEAFKDNPPGLIIFENVPRIAIRGRHLLDQIISLLRNYGFEVNETTHDCGEIGGLGQSRKRFLLVARQRQKVPPFLYEPEKRRLRGVGEILERLPLPGVENAGPMHRMPALQWKTWVRLAFVEAGSDWRSLNRLNVANGVLTDFAIVPEAMRDGGLGVRRWNDPSGVITSRGGPTNGNFAVADPRGFSKEGVDFHGLKVNDWAETAGAVTTQRSPGSSAQSVADPRIDGHEKSVQHGVGTWDQPAAVVKGDVSVGTGRYAVADPRCTARPPHFSNVFRIVSWADYAGAITAGTGPTSGGPAVADPRCDWNENAHGSKLAVQAWDDAARTIGGARFGSGGGAVADPRPAQRDDYKQTKYRVCSMDEPAGTVIAASTTGNGAFAVADPRTGLDPDRPDYKTGGHYGVVPWDQSSRAVLGFSKYDRAPFSVADPRDTGPAAAGEGQWHLPRPEERIVAVIRALDGTWHRPFTTLELAALQSLVDPDEVGDFALDGQSDSAWRERIGNAVPPDAAAAIASVMGTTLLLAMAGETFVLSSQSIWVRPIALALAIDHSPNEGAYD